MIPTFLPSLLHIIDNSFNPFLLSIQQILNTITSSVSSFDITKNLFGDSFTFEHFLKFSMMNKVLHDFVSRVYFLEFIILLIEHWFRHFQANCKLIMNKLPFGCHLSTQLNNLNDQSNPLQPGLKLFNFISFCILIRLLSQQGCFNFGPKVQALIKEALLSLGIN